MSIYFDRSFVIVNSSSMPLDFLLTSNLQPYELTELSFSLSRSSLRVFNTLHVDANSQVKVFVHFCPHPGATESNRAIDAPSHLREVKIYLNCKLIKDFQQIVLLQASCRFPQMSVRFPSCMYFLTYTLSGLHLKYCIFWSRDCT